MLRYLVNLIESSYIHGKNVDEISRVLLKEELTSREDYRSYVSGLSDIRLLDICVSYYLSRYMDYELAFQYTPNYRLYKVADTMNLGTGEPFNGKGELSFVKGIKYKDAMLFSCFGRTFYVHKDYRLDDSIPVAYYNVCIDHEVYLRLIDNGINTTIQALWGYLVGIPVVKDYAVSYVKQEYRMRYCNKNVILDTLHREIGNDSIVGSNIYEKDFKYSSGYLYIDGSIYRLGYNVKDVNAVYGVSVLSDGVYLVDITDMNKILDLYLFVVTYNRLRNRVGSSVITAEKCDSVEAKRLLLL